MQGEEDGKLILVPFDKGNKTYLEFVKDSIYNWFTNNMNGFIYTYNIYNLSAYHYRDGTVAVKLYVRCDGYVEKSMLLDPGIFTFDDVAAKIDELQFSEEKNQLEFINKPANLLPVIERRDYEINITNVVSKYLCDVIRCTTFKGFHEILVCHIHIKFSNVTCSIIISNNITIYINFADDRSLGYDIVLERNDITQALEDVFMDYFNKYKDEDDEAKYATSGPIVEDFNDIVFGVEFNDFLREIFKLDIFDHIRYGMGWYPKVRAAIKEE